MILKGDTMQKITPFLWFNNNAEEAATFYTSLFRNSGIGNIHRYGDAGPGPKGSVMTLTFQLEGLQFMALNGGPVFAFTPATSMFVSLESQEDIDAIWRALSKGGKVLMELGKYPFSERFGWVQDSFGLSWQLYLGKGTRRVTPFLMYIGQQGKAEEAIRLYSSVFKNSCITTIARYEKGEPGVEGAVKHAVFSLDGQEFMAMDSNGEHNFTFTEAFSLYVNCETQLEVDELWEKLSQGGSKGQCGWLKDRYCVSWQIVPTALGKMLGDSDPERSKRVTKAMLQMKKLDIAGLKRAYEQP